MSSDLRRALEEIASASPEVHSHATGSHRCTMCWVMIDTAREALGYKEWPARPRTPSAHSLPPTEGDAP